MSVLAIRKAQREGARLVIMLAGVSGSGKTRTALEIAYGLSNFKPSEIGFLDTENRRGSLYADVYQGNRERASNEPFLIGDLYAPFSPGRYVDAIREFQAAGVKVLIIDSGTHEWEGTGGCMEIAEAGTPKLPNWNKAKGEHKRFMNTLLTCDMHVILCLRAREKAKPEMKTVDGREKLVYVDMGLQAVTEKNVLFEATVSLMLHSNGTTQEVVKCPGDLLPVLGRGRGYITDQDGHALRRWVDGAQQLDPEVERHRNILISIADQGSEPLKAAWEATPKRVKTALGVPFLDTCKAAAAEFERQQREAEGAGDGNAEALNEALAGAVGEGAPRAAAPAVAAAEEPAGEQPIPPAESTGAAEPAAKAPRKGRAGSNPPPPAGPKPQPPANPPAATAATAAPVPAAAPKPDTDLF